jgi:hypothetical protein
VPDGQRRGPGADALGQRVRQAEGPDIGRDQLAKAADTLRQTLRSAVRTYSNGPDLDLCLEVLLADALLTGRLNQDAAGPAIRRTDDLPLDPPSQLMPGAVRATVHPRLVLRLLLSADSRTASSHPAPSRAVDPRRRRGRVR